MRNTSITDLHANFMFLLFGFSCLPIAHGQLTEKPKNNRGGSGFAASVYGNHYETDEVMDSDFYQVKRINLPTDWQITSREPFPQKEAFMSEIYENCLVHNYRDSKAAN